jgi:hypothetical protein
MSMQVERDVDDQIARALEPLRRRYVPVFGAEAVDAAIDEAVEHFSTARLREHLPILIERRARATLDGRSG